MRRYSPNLLIDTCSLQRKGDRGRLPMKLSRNVDSTVLKRVTSTQSIKEGTRSFFFFTAGQWPYFFLSMGNFTRLRLMTHRLNILLSLSPPGITR